MGNLSMEKYVILCVLFKNEILVEGESHFLLNCSKYMYSHFRTELFNDIGYNPTIAMSNFDCILFFYCQIFLRQTSKYLLLQTVITV